MVEVREAGLDDLPELLSMGRKLIEHLVPLEKKRRKTKLLALDEKNADKVWKKYYTKNLKSDKSLFLVALKKGEIVGMGMGRIEKSPPVFKIKEFGQIHELFVKESCRRQGVCQALIKRLEDFFREKGVSVVHISVENYNTEALNLYYKLGYQDSRFLLHKEL